MNVFHELSRPFPERKVHWRIGSTNQKAEARRTGDKNAKPTKGIPLAYIDARDVMDRLDFVVGPENWQDRYPFEGCCEIGIKFIDSIINRNDPRPSYEWIWKSNGAGKTDFEGEKGQYSDAFKRAAVLWGIGRYLYGLPNEWVDLDNYGKPKTQPKLPAWATPNGWNIIPVNEKRQIYTDVIDALSEGDEIKLLEVLNPYKGDADKKVIIHQMFNSFQRAAIKEFLK